MRRALLVVLVVALALMALAPIATAGVGGGPADVHCETDGGVKGRNGTTYFVVEVDGVERHSSVVENCPLRA